MGCGGQLVGFKGKIPDARLVVGESVYGRTTMTCWRARFRHQLLHQLEERGMDAFD
jgi:hypothetical protein